MSSRARVSLPLEVAVVFMVAGFAVIGGSAWFAAGQSSALFLFPFVLVAAGLGVGLVAAGSVLYATARRRRAEARTEDVLAEVLLAAARLSDARRR